MPGAVPAFSNIAILLNVDQLNSQPELRVPANAKFARLPPHNKINFTIKNASDKNIYYFMKRMQTWINAPS